MGQQLFSYTKSEMVERAASVVVVLLSAAVHGTVLTHCINNCTGVTNGDYNSCDACTEIVTCSEGRMSKTQCSVGTFFDSEKGYCDWTSSTCTETNSTSSPDTQSDPTDVLTTTAQTTTSERGSSTNSPINQSSSLDVQTTPSQTTDGQISSSNISPTIQSNSSDAQIPIFQSDANKTSTTETQSTESQPSVSTVEVNSSNVPPTTAQNTAGRADVKTFLYIRVHYQTVLCCRCSRTWVYPSKIKDRMWEHLQQNHKMLVFPAYNITVFDV